MNFKQYLSELYNIEVGQAEVKHEPSNEGSSSISNPKIRAEMNFRLMNELNNNHLSPQSGIQAIRKVLHRFSFDLPALYDIDPEADEIALELDQFGIVKDPEDIAQNVPEGDKLSKDPVVHYIYIVYYLTENGNYEFYAEIVDAETLDEILADEEEDSEELE